MALNLEVAVMTKLNELAARYGIRPDEFEASIKYPSEFKYVLQIESFNIDAEDNLAKMVKAMGIDSSNEKQEWKFFDSSDQTTDISGKYGNVLNILDEAIAKAPTPRKTHR